MLRWDLRTDELVAGQWLVGRLYESACGLSPDGELLVYYARKGRLKFTAVSRPPYFTALAYWEDGWPPTAGGFFDGNRRLVIGQRYDSSYRAGDIPADFEVTSAWDHFFGARPFTSWSDVIPQSRERNQGWCALESQIYAKPNPSREHRSLRLERESTGTEVGYRLVDDSANQGESSALTRDLGPLDWADWDHDGSLLYSREGCLYREQIAATGDAPRLEAVLVADLRDQVFENILPSKAARTWPRGR